ncbi:MAG: T9SS type A sorting domain-containing protein [Chitinophagaceae bacterium]|jgi:hypothetical protein|nr:T9SS type A sorting domain-containing protein [Chitinophagaceae bacterium]
MKKNYLRLAAILLCIIVSSIIKAQSPGGVKSPEMWLKVVPLTADVQGNYRWQDFGGDSIKFNQYDNRGGAYGTEWTGNRATYIHTYNFNPSIDIDGSSGRALWFPKTNLAQCMIIGVWGSNFGDFDQDMYMYALNGRPGDGVLMSKSLILPSKESGRSLLAYGADTGMNLLFKAGVSKEPNVYRYRERALRVHSYYRLHKPNNNDVWGDRQTANISPSNVFNTADVNNSSTFDLTHLTNRTFWGFVPEMVVYNRMLTPLERMKVEAYLSLKYGFTLTNSYISSTNKLIWDLSTNTGYNTRITGIMRDDSSGLLQPLSTTSFEDSANYSDDNPFDTYDGNNSYNLPTRYRLLIMGRPYGTNMSDGDYTIWGDDNQSFRVPATNPRIIGGLKTMSRDWKVRTNVVLPDNSVMAQKGLWNHTELQFVEGVNSNFIKESTDASPTGMAVTTQPLSGPNGYFGFVYASTPSGGVTIKFTPQNSLNQTLGNSDYGYYINSFGFIYPITAGVQSANAIANIFAGQKIMITKTANRVTLRVNGALVSYTNDLIIASGDVSATFYGALRIDRGSSVINLTAFIANGFYYGSSSYKSNGGHYLELSYDASRASNFNNAINGQAYLIIDRSGTGTYPTGQTDYYQSDETDVSREKIIFNNVQWNTGSSSRSSNGISNTGSSNGDVFTFGYLDAGKLAVSVDSTNPTCNNGVPNNDGSIKINLLSGLKGINYSIVNTNDTSIHYNGRFFTDSLLMDSLPVGAYTIQLSEIGGYDFRSSSTSTFRPSAYSNGYTYNTNCAISFLAGIKDSGAAVGFKMLPAGIFTIPSTGINLPDYGVMKIDSVLYPVTPNGQPAGSVNSVGVVGSTPVSTSVRVGDSISVEINSGNFLIKVNGAIVSSTAMPSSDLNNYYRGAVTLPSGVASSEVYNLNITGIAGGIWLVSNNITETLSANAATTATATLSNNCQAASAGTLAISVNSVNPTSVNRITNTDGSITVHLLSGLPGVNYSVIDSNDVTVHYNGELFADSLRLSGLPAGTYTIKMGETGGNDIQSTGTAAATFRPSAVSGGSIYGGNSAVDFLAGIKDSGAAVGFKIAPGKFAVPATGFNLPDYGVLKNGSILYLIAQGTSASIPITTSVQPNDRIKVEKNAGNLVISINGTAVSTTAIPEGDQNQYYYAAVTLPAGNSDSSHGGIDAIQIDNLNITGFTGGTWQTPDNITVKQSNLATAAATVTLSANAVPATKKLIVYNKNLGNTMNFTAKVTLDNPGNSQILVFNLLGILVYQAMLNGNAKVQEKDITVQVPGIYFVKALTPEGEFTQKVAAVR